MRTSLALAGFAAGLAVVFGGAVGLGHAVGPVGGTTDQHAGHGAVEASSGSLPSGLSVASDGYALELDTPTLPLGRPAELAFRLLGTEGRPVTRYAATHDKDLHLIVVRRDGAGFQHLHPQRDSLGRWSTQVVLPLAGAYKVFADSVPQGRSQALVLSSDLSVAGEYRPQPLPAQVPTAEIDGYTVSLSGDLVAGTSSRAVLHVTRHGLPVTDLQPYLGAYGHLVTLRVGDLAYLHTHPVAADGGHGHAGGGPDIAFSVEVPTVGSYRLYLGFQHGGVVRTAELAAVARERS